MYISIATLFLNLLQYVDKCTLCLQLSEISGVEAENLEFAKGRGTFPCDMSVMDIDNDLDWTPRSGPLDQRPLYIMDDGAMIYYK